MQHGVIRLRYLVLLLVATLSLGIAAAAPGLAFTSSQGHALSTSSFSQAATPSRGIQSTLSVVARHSPPQPQIFGAGGRGHPSPSNLGGPASISPAWTVPVLLGERQWSPSRTPASLVPAAQLGRSPPAPAGL